jgi:Protein of unknown function (DUF2795)
LSGVDDPVDKRSLVDRAREQGADRAVLEALADREYDAPDELSGAAVRED